MKILDNKTERYCESCRRETETTVCALCLHCSRRIIADRRKMFTRSDGDGYMRRMFGRAFNHYFQKQAEKDSPRVVKR